MRRIADGEEYSVPATIDDPAILQEITVTLELLGYGSAAVPAGGG
jgi:propionyl-CoA synthetase